MGEKQINADQVVVEKIDALIGLLEEYKQDRERNKSLQEHQAKIQELQEKHNAEIEQYQVQYEELLEYMALKIW